MASVKSATPLEEIARLQAQIETLKDGAVNELKERRTALEQELKNVDAELEKLLGKPLAVRRTRRPGPQADAPARTPDLQELKEILASAPEKTLSIRKEGFDLRNIKIMAAANPHLLKLGGKGPWPTVTLLR